MAWPWVSPRCRRAAARHDRAGASSGGAVRRRLGRGFRLGCRPAVLGVTERTIHQIGPCTDGLAEDFASMPAGRGSARPSWRFVWWGGAAPAWPRGSRRRVRRRFWYSGCTLSRSAASIWATMIACAGPALAPWPARSPPGARSRATLSLPAPDRSVIAAAPRLSPSPLGGSGDPSAGGVAKPCGRSARRRPRAWPGPPPARRRPSSPP